LAGGRCARLGKLSARSAWKAQRAARSTRTLDRVLKAFLLALVIVTAMYLLVAKTKFGDIGFRELKEGEPDKALGAVVIVLSVALMAFLTLVPPREGATYSSRMYLWGYASLGLGWGSGQWRRSKSRRRRRSS
jgi:hypothetical protein